MSKKILIATAKPFAPEAVESVRQFCDDKDHELTVLKNMQIKMIW